MVEDFQSKSAGPLFTHSSVAEGRIWPFYTNVKISVVREFKTIKKLMIATFDKRITVWDPVK